MMSLLSVMMMISFYGVDGDNKRTKVLGRITLFSEKSKIEQQVLTNVGESVPWRRPMFCHSYRAVLIFKGGQPHDSLGATSFMNIPQKMGLYFPKRF